jgi:hypothetical protein
MAVRLKLKFSHSPQTTSATVRITLNRLNLIEEIVWRSVDIGDSQIPWEDPLEEVYQGHLGIAS